MKNTVSIHLILFLFGSLASPCISSQDHHALTIEVLELRDSTGVVQFALYNRPNVFPDEHYQKCFKITTAKIVDGKASATFENLPEGTYAVNILHDEDKNGKIKMGWVLPKEGIGFSNYESIGVFNKPEFSKASFELRSDTAIQIKIIYM